jgi:hypothetical protein
LEAILDITGQADRCLPGGLVMQEVFAVFVPMGARPVDMEKVPRHVR